MESIAVNSAQDAPPVVSPARWETFLARGMFGLALFFLVVAAGAIHRVGRDLGTDFEEYLILAGLGFSWPLFVAENIFRFLVGRWAGLSFQRRLFTLILGCVIPPVRLCFRAYADPGQVWLPWLGWSVVNKHLRRKLEKFFSVPMIVIALMILPFLALEFYWGDQIREHFGLALFLDIGSSIIWLAFAIEFILMVTVAENKARYCLQNWMDLAVVLLPVIDFLPVLRLLRLTRILQLQQLSRMGRVYRLRGLLWKLWRAILVLEMIQRIFGQNREKRLARLKELLAAKVEELADLRKEIAELEELLAHGKFTTGGYDPLWPARSDPGAKR